MAKLKGPLMSLGASGQLAKTLVFFPWKGLNVAREYIVPSNPKTALQTTQRGYMTDAVALVHLAQADATNPLKSVDQVAYSALASAKGQIMTWFNQACKLYIDVIRVPLTPCVYCDFTVTDPSRLALDIIAYLIAETPSDLAAGKWYIGTSKTNLIHAVAGTVIAGASVRVAAVDLSAWMVAGVKYYTQFRPDAADPCEGADSGIYNFVAT